MLHFLSLCYLSPREALHIFTCNRHSVNMQFDAEVELEKAAKETSADKKRKQKAKVLRKQMAQKDAEEKAKKAASRPKVLQVQGKGSGKKNGVDEGWFMDADEGGVPPRKRALAILSEKKDEDGSGSASV